jgi:hypothetical protein
MNYPAPWVRWGRAIKYDESPDEKRADYTRKQRIRQVSCSASSFFEIFASLPHKPSSDILRHPVTYFALFCLFLSLPLNSCGFLRTSFDNDSTDIAKHSFKVKEKNSTCYNK